jgi:hypothetical protein
MDCSFSSRQGSLLQTGRDAPELGFAGQRAENALPMRLSVLPPVEI